MHEAIIRIMVIMSHLIMSLVSNLGSTIAAPEWRVQSIKKHSNIFERIAHGTMQVLFFEVIDASYI